MKKRDAQQLLNKYREGICTEEEKALLEKWYFSQPEREFDLSIEEIDAIGNEIWQKLPIHHQKRTIKMWPRIAAAMVLATVGVGSYFYFTGNNNQLTEYATDLAPGGNKAYLTLSDGRRISLTDAKDSKIAEQSGIKISKTADGQLLYEISDAALSAKAASGQYNTIDVPKSGQYQVRLPDGTKVWLNSASSLRYPLSFANLSARRVTLTGEAYFEVAHLKKQPFVVKTNAEEVEVLGTHFNVNTYNDEPETKTTLLEGSVKITPATAAQNKPEEAILKPGEQGVLTAGRIRISPADTEEALAWKSGYFIFKNEDVKSVMRKVARWYDVDVVYETDTKNITYEGSISRFKNVSELLHKFELTGSLKFKLEGRRITVMK